MFSTLTILTALATLTGPAPQGATGSRSLQQPLAQQQLAPQPASRSQVVRASGEELASARGSGEQGIEGAAAEASLQPAPSTPDDAQPANEPRRNEPPPRR